VPENGVRSTYSQSPVQIHLCDDQGVISTGTAFFYAVEKSDYLVTSWHNISGKDPFDNTYLCKIHRVPLIVKAKFATWIGAPAGKTFTTVATDVPIYNSDRSAPLWFEHPEFGFGCDVAAIPFNRTKAMPDFMHNSANSISSIRIPIKPGNPVFIIGFPKSLSIAFGLPIWKSGFLASEPHYDITWGGKLSEIGGMSDGTKIPAFFLDSLTREGMSGSPVFASFIGNWDMTDPYRELKPDEPTFWTRNDIALGENRLEFVGLYGGRVPSSEGDAALGFCWKESAIKRICVSQHIGRHPHK
jgi:hypothetical protein